MSTSCKISFPDKKDFYKAIDTLIYESNDSFTGVDKNTLIISKDQCVQLEQLSNDGKLSFSVLDY
ncbi:MAG: hypothetical protein AB7V56_04785 [Candidatus Nitrosocosmicus sp.]